MTTKENISDLRKELENFSIEARGKLSVYHYLRWIHKYLFSFSIVIISPDCNELIEMYRTGITIPTKTNSAYGLFDGCLTSKVSSISAILILQEHVD